MFTFTNEINFFLKCEFANSRRNTVKGKQLKRKTKLLLETELNELEKLIDVTGHNDQVINSYTDVNEKLEKIYKQESKGAGIRARTRWMEEGEKSTTYFLNLEKSNAKKKTRNNTRNCSKK